MCAFLLVAWMAVCIQVSEGANRVDIAWHYLIPYPRLHHQKQFKYREAPILNLDARKPAGGPAE